MSGANYNFLTQHLLKEQGIIYGVRLARYHSQSLQKNFEKVLGIRFSMLTFVHMKI